MRVVLALAFLALVPAAAVGCGGDGPDARRSATVEIVDFRFEPKTIRVEAGGEVKWLNSDVAPHTATADDRQEFDTGTLRTGESKTIAFSEPGSYRYFCRFHPFMVGTVEVVE